MKQIRQILIVSISAVILLIGIILYQILTHKPVSDLECFPQAFFCGTVGPELTENQKEGKEIFNRNCAPCHKLDIRSTGPALRNIDSLVFIKWILPKNHKIDTAKIERLGVDYHRTMFKEYVSEKDLMLLIDYCSSERY